MAFASSLARSVMSALVGLVGYELGRDEELCIFSSFIAIVASLCFCRSGLSTRYRVHF